MTAPSPQPSRNWEILCHLSALSGILIPPGFFLGPLTIWLLKRSELPEVDVQGKASVNFQLSMLIYFLVASVLSILIIGFFLMIVVWIVDVVLVVMASIKTSEGEPYDYPFTLNLIR